MGLTAGSPACGTTNVSSGKSSAIVRLRRCAFPTMPSPKHGASPGGGGTAGFSLRAGAGIGPAAKGRAGSPDPAGGAAAYRGWRDGGRQLPGRARCRCHTVTVASEEAGQQGCHDKRELSPNAGVEVVLVSPQNVMQLTPDLVPRDGDHGRCRAGDLSVGLSATEAAPIAGVRCPVADIANPGGDQGHGGEVPRRRVG